MEAEITKKELKDALAGLTKVISRHSRLPILHGIKFHTKDGILHATATDMEQVATYAFASAVIKSPGAFVVNCEALKPFTKGSDKETVTVNSGDSLIISHQISGHSIAEQIPTYDVEEFPPDTIDVPTSKVDDNFLAHFRKAQTFVSTDEKRNVLTAVCLDVSDGKGSGHCIVGTDGSRLACFNSMSLPVAESCNVKPAKFLNWSKLTGDIEIGLKSQKEYQCFALRNGCWTYIARTIDGKYPNWRQVVPKDVNAHSIRLADTDADVLLQTLPWFAGNDNKNHSITIVGKDGRVSIHGYSNESAAWLVLELNESTFEGVDNLITLDRRFLLDALNIGFRQFAFNDNTSPLLSHDGNGGKYVLMPTTPMIPDGVVLPVLPVATEDAQAPDVKIQSEEDNGGQVNTPEPADAVKPKVQEDESMSEQTVSKEASSETPLDRILVAYEAVKIKINDARSGLNEIADAIKQAVKDQKSQRGELENARALLAKLQAVKL